jgi:hypothetical protein
MHCPQCGMRYALRLCEEQSLACTSPAAVGR